MTQIHKSSRSGPQSQVTTTESVHHQQNNGISIPVGFNSSKDISQYKESNKLYKLVKVKTSFVLIITKDYNWTLTDISKIEEIKH